MGEVWLAEHIEIARQVAVKLMLGSKDPDRDARFLREAKATARIRHPGIVAVSDYGTREVGGAYLVMELLDGETLGDRLARGPIALAVTIEIARQISEGLAAAHAAGVIHRDLKPANLFLVPDATARGGLRVKLVDFGVARWLEPANGDLETGAGAVIGTPLYMAPEQLCGRSTLDHRADLYSLGVVLHELCTGRPPFRGPSLGDLVDQHINVAPPRIDAAPPLLAALVARLLAKDPSDRPADAESVARTLAALDGSEATAFVSGLDVTAPGLEVVALASPRPRGRILGMLSLGLGLAVSVAVVGTSLSRADEPAADRAGQPPIAALLPARLGTAQLAAARPDFVAAFRWYLMACDAGDRGSCTEVARFYESGTGVRGDGKRARQAAETACAAGDPGGCTLAGSMLRRGVGGPVAIEPGIALEERGCAFGDPQGCFAVALAHATGIGRPRDAGASAAAFARTRLLADVRCSEGHEAACATLGTLLMEPRAGATDPERASMLLERACMRSQRAACVVASDLAQLGYGGERDPAHARALLQRACDGGVGDGCVALAVDLMKGVTGPIDPPRAAETARRACDKLGDRYCLALAMFHRDGDHVAKDPSLAASLMRRACAAGHPLSCFFAVEIRALGTVPDAAADLAALHRGCDLGEGLACVALGARHEEAHRFTEAAVSYELACALSTGESAGCDSLALLYLAGTGVPKDTDRGWRMLESACAGQSGRACRILGTRLRDGDGRPADAGEALRVLERGCSMNNGLACMTAAEMVTDPKHGLTPDPGRAGALRAKACAIKPSYCS